LIIGKKKETKKLSEKKYIKSKTKKNIQEKKVIYDHFADKRKSKVMSSGTLKKLNINDLPEYISQNTNKFQEWID